MSGESRAQLRRLGVPEKDLDRFETAAAEIVDQAVPGAGNEWRDVSTGRRLLAAGAVWWYDEQVRAGVSACPIYCVHDCSLDRPCEDCAEGEA